MPLLDTAIFGLLATSLLFTIIELGLTAYAVSLTDGYSYYYHDPVSRIDFLLFCSIWTLLVTAVLLVFPMMSARRGNGSHRLATITTLVLNCLTMIFWLAGFAAYADLFRGGNPIQLAGAVLAFAIMIWLIFLALVIANVLAVIGVLRSDRLGYGPMGRKQTLP